MDQTQTADGFTQELTKKLNAEQKEAVLTTSASCLVLAGAGSGKTTVLISKIINYIRKGLPASAILSVTFTNKAANEMMKRLQAKVPKDELKHMWSGTFHSLCSRMLRSNHQAAGLPQAFAILDPDAQEVMIKTITGDSNRDNQEEESDEEGLTAKDALRYINSKKEFGIRPEDIDPAGPVEQQLVEIYSQYQLACSQQGVLDFSDLLYKTVEMLERSPEVREKYRNLFSVILVDEFQDTNDVQYRFLQLIKHPKARVTAVGDDDQSIYAFRGANPGNMQRFVSEMTVTPANPDGLIIRLVQNYRSLPFILNAANAVIGKNANRLGKDLRSDMPDRGERVSMTTFENGATEAATIAKEIHTMYQTHGVPASEIAVLYRTNTQSRQLEQELNKLAVPTTVYGGFRFFERQEIKHVLAYMELISHVDRDIAMLRIINVPVRGLGAKTVEELRQEAREQKVSLIEMIVKRSERPAASQPTGAAATKQRILEQFAHMICDLNEASKTISMSELVSKILDEVGLRSHYEKGDGKEAEERILHIEDMISAARQFEIDRPELKNAAEQLPEYLNFVRLVSSTEEEDMDKKNTVSLMTVHAAKGLEFDNVFIVGLEEGTFPHQRSIAENDGIVVQDLHFEAGDLTHDYDDDGNLTDAATEQLRLLRESTPLQENPELQEERRLLYVALTRARHTLKLSCAKSRIVNGEHRFPKPSRFIKEIPARYLTEIRDRTPGTSFLRGRDAMNSDSDDLGQEQSRPPMRLGDSFVRSK